MQDVYKRQMQYMTELAESGNEYALVKLGFEYLKGENVERNIFSAYNYFSQAAAQGNQLAETMMQGILLYEMKFWIFF